MRLLKELVSINTDASAKSNYVEMARYLAGRLKEMGAKAEILYADAKDGRPRPNVLGYIDNGFAETVALNSHFDVMPVTRGEWKGDPFKLRISGGRAYGRGTNDDKGGIVAAIAAAREAKAKTNIELLFTCDEEVGSKYGLEWLMAERRRKIKSTSAIVLDTARKIDIGASGVVMGRITVRGRETHA